MRPKSIKKLLKLKLLKGRYWRQDKNEGNALTEDRTGNRLPILF